VNKLRSCESSALKFSWFSFYLDVPFFPFLHLEELLDHADNRLHLLLWILLDFVEQESHVLAIVSDGVWDTIQQAELWDQADLSSILLSK
jgi:hypothetical protein